MAKMYCCEFENTKDGLLNYSPENLLNRQLIFTRHLTSYQRKKYRWIDISVGDYSQEEIIRKFINKFPTIERIDWEEIKDELGHSWSAWVIKEKEATPKE